MVDGQVLVARVGGVAAADVIRGGGAVGLFVVVWVAIK